MTIKTVLIGLGALVVGIIVAPGPGESQVCPPTAAVGCRTATSSVFTFKNRADDDKDRLVWRWLKGESTTVEEFLDPTTTVTTALCIYAGTSASLIDSATLPPSDTLWHVGNSLGADGLKIWYKDPDRTTDGIRYVLLRSGGDGGARIIVKGRGADVPHVSTPLPMADLPLVVQLHQDDGPPCWSSTFTERKVNHAAKVKAKSP
jgi:hypothetical protein